MQNSNDLELSRRAVVLGGAASVALTTISTGTALAQSGQVVGPQVATIPVALEINGKVRDLHLDTRTTLLDALREHLQQLVELGFRRFALVFAWIEVNVRALLGRG